MDVKTLRDICQEAVLRGGDVLRTRKGTRRTIDFKSRRDIVTDADKASERVILDYLRQVAPNDAVLAEEAGHIDGEQTRSWLVDPLDGTTNFASGINHYCVTVAVRDSQGMVACATFDPATNELYTAGRGQGATLNDERLRATTCADLADAVIATSAVAGASPTSLAALFDKLSGARAVRRFGASALDLAWIAAGRLDGFWEPSIKPWDIGAGVLLVQEAGGVVTGFEGEAVHPLPRGICAGSARIQPLLLDLFRRARTESH